MAVGTRGILRRVLEGGFQDPRRLSPEERPADIAELIQEEAYDTGVA
jgi:hypothetical protein